MNLVKWLRKNNTKIMAVVVIVLMIGFIGGSSLTYLLGGRGVANNVEAYYGNNIRITRYDLLAAQQEMEILKQVQAPNFLKALSDRVTQSPDFHSLVLGELLFNEERPSAEVITYLQQAAGRFQYRISNEEINDLYSRTVPGYYFWYLLNKEAENAGFMVKNDEARSYLTQALPQLTGQNYAQYIGALMRTNVLSEKQILSTFAKLLALLKYSHAVCSGQDMTIQQLKHTAAWQEESLNIEFVKFDAEKFIKTQETPNEEQINQQFDKFRKFSPDEVTDENPYGFGYKLPDRVQLEYITLKLDDVKEIVKKPAFDEIEAYYSNNKEREFTQQVHSDPNDPNSKMISQVKPFSEVSDIISDKLMQEKINNKATAIIQEAKTIGDGKLQDINDTELDKLNTEDRKEVAGSYTNASESLSKKYNIHIYHGTTGELSAVDMQTDKYLSSLYLQGYVNNLSLARVVFAVDKLGLSELGSYELIKPKVYLSLGPVKDRSGRLLALIRVVKALKESVPEDINQKYSMKSFNFDTNQESTGTEKQEFSVKENVEKDLKRLAAMKTAKDRANELIELASMEGQTWENAVNKLNVQYGLVKANDVNDPNAALITEPNDVNEPPFELQNMTDLRRLSTENLYTLSLLVQSNPAHKQIDRDRKKGALFVNLMFSQAPQTEDSNTPEFKPQAIEFKPDMSYYAIKNISVKPLWKEDYEKLKAIATFSEDHVETQSLALVQFNPQNIIKRMNFKFTDASMEKTIEEPNESEE